MIMPSYTEDLLLPSGHFCFFWKKKKKKSISISNCDTRYLCSFSATMQWFVHEKNLSITRKISSCGKKIEERKKKSSNYRALEAFQMITWLHDEIRKRKKLTLLYYGDNLLLSFWVCACDKFEPVWTSLNKFKLEKTRKIMKKWAYKNLLPTLFA